MNPPSFTRRLVATALLCCTLSWACRAAEPPAAGADAGTLADLPALLGRFDAERLLYFHILPPDGQFRLSQEAGLFVFEPGGFPREFLSGLEAGEEFGCPVYRLVISEDRDTRETVFANGEGKPFCVVAPAKDYDPRWALASLFPDACDGTRPPEEVAWLEMCYDPSLISIRLTLLPAAHAGDYAAAVAGAAALSASPGGGMPAMGYGGPPVTDLVFTAIGRQTNGMLATLAYPGDFTNRVDVFTTAGLVDSWWDLAVTTNVNPATNWIEWLDTAAPTVPARFYAAGNADTNSVTDPDGDGLAAARERFLYHTSPTNADTDADGLGDYAEVIDLRTDPNDPDTNAPAAWIDFPGNGLERMWMP